MSLPPALVTGGTGFVGRHLIGRLLSERRDVIALSTHARLLDDLRHPNLQVLAVDWRSLDRYADQLPPGLDIFHLASARAYTGTPITVFQHINVDATLALASAFKHKPRCRFVYVSTALILEDLDDEPTIKGGLVETNPYLASKARALEGMLELQEAGLNLVTVYPVIIFGPDHPSRPNRVTRQMRRLLRSRLSIVIDGGRSPRGLLYIDDAVAGLLSAAHPSATERHLLLPGHPISHAAFDDLVLQVAGRKRLGRISIPATWARIMGRAADLRFRPGTVYSYTDALDMLLRPWIFTGFGSKETAGLGQRPLEDGVGATLRWMNRTGRPRWLGEESLPHV